ncbi:hypothetical protein Ddc_21878 [Ditylenchus destructor]|nr:hypothetical protein Ddc_21878 [Ditylenchus destructor]
MAAWIDGKQVGLQTEKYPASELKNGMVLYLEVDAERVKVFVNGDDLMEYSHQVDIAKYPITNLDVLAADGRFSLSLLAMLDKPHGFERKCVGCF